MKRRRAQSGTLFLMEIILAILFFSAASAVCVGVFVNAHILSRDAQRLNTAVSLCSTAAETVDSGRDFEDVKTRLSLIFPDGEWDGNSFSAAVYDGSASDGEEAFGTLELSLTPETGESLFRAEIRVLQEGEEDAVYETCVERHFPLER